MERVSPRLFYNADAAGLSYLSHHTPPSLLYFRATTRVALHAQRCPFCEVVALEGKAGKTYTSLRADQGRNSPLECGVPCSAKLGADAFFDAPHVGLMLTTTRGNPARRWRSASDLQGRS